MNTYAAHELLALRSGMKIRCLLQSGREVVAQIERRPFVSTAGKPGLHRVRIPVVDLEHAEKLQGNNEGFAPGATAPAHHEIPGTRVLEVLK